MKQIYASLQFCEDKIRLLIGEYYKTRFNIIKLEEVDCEGLKAFHIQNKEKTKEGSCMLDIIALILLIVGGINWGSIGLFRFDIVAWICGGQTATVSRVIYTLVGLAALWCISLLFRRDALPDEA